jgi:hypothetical protein
VIEALVSVIDGLVDADPGTLSDSDTVVALHRQLARLDAVTSRASARWDADGEWAGSGARSGAAWLAARTHVPRSEANRRLRLGRALRHLPHTEQAWLAGSISSAHVSALAAARTDELTDAMARDEAALVTKARTLHFSRFRRDLEYWRLTNDPDSEDRRFQKQVDGRYLHLSETFQNTWALDGRLDPISGSVVSDTLGRIERELFDQDWKEAAARLGRDPIVAELQRTPAQRRADALVEMAIRARTSPKGGRRPEPLFTVTIGLPRFEQLCELANGTVIPPGSLVPYLTSAWIERVVFGPKSRVLDVGVKQRLFTGADRRAVEVRDRNQCFHDLCDDEAEQIDHIQPFAWGGPTTQTNGRGACGFHNRDRHRHRGPPTGG